MKSIVTLFLLAAFCGSQTWAGEAAKRKPASALGLSGQNATDMVNLLKEAGIQTSPLKTVIQAFDIVCQGFDFKDSCLIATQSNDPAAHRVFLSFASAGKFWSLLKTAGIQQHQSDLTDGTAGQFVIEAGTVTCSLSSGGGSNECSFSVVPNSSS